MEWDVSIVLYIKIYMDGSVYSCMFVLFQWDFHKRKQEIERI